VIMTVVEVEVAEEEEVEVTKAPEISQTTKI
jgi:hypothetical protein